MRHAAQDAIRSALALLAIVLRARSMPVMTRVRYGGAAMIFMLRCCRY